MLRCKIKRINSPYLCWSHQIQMSVLQEFQCVNDEAAVFVFGPEKTYWDQLVKYTSVWFACVAHTHILMLWFEKFRINLLSIYINIVCQNTIWRQQLKKTPEEVQWFNPERDECEEVDWDSFWRHLMFWTNSIFWYCNHI
jgi:hypothetical protein